LIDGSDQPHITDFGVAKLIENDSGLTATGNAVGTPSFMSPEQAAGKQVGRSTDI
jgi:serine/threonine protein kinase